MFGRVMLFAMAALQIHWVGGAPEDVARVTIVARDLSGAERTFADAKDVELPGGQWFVRAVAPGWWSEETLIVGGAAPTITLERATTLHAGVNVDAQNVTIHFRPPKGGAARAQRCAIVEKKIACDVPAGEHDLVFRIDGYASVYRWNEKLRAPKADLGVLAFKKGSTFSGRIEITEKIPENTRIDVALTPAAATSQHETMEARASITRVVAQPNARGFFSMDVAPGRYVVQATAGLLFASEEREVNVLDGRETSLREPLLLERPRVLTVRVQPAQDPFSRSWTVIANRRSARTDEQGVATFATAPGTVDIDVRSGESTWHTAQVDLRDDLTHDAVLNQTVVRGTVTLGDEPLPSAWITFAAERSLVRVRGSKQGTFSAFLPRRERWERIDVKTDRVFATLTDVRYDDELTIALPGTSLGGTVVDESGRAIEALVSIFDAQGGQYHQLPADGGAFELAGLPRGEYTLQAMTRDRRSESVAAKVDDHADVTITVVKTPSIEGVVRSAFGPVGSAGFFITRTGEIPPAIALYAVQPDGRYGFTLPAGTRDVTMVFNAPGYAFRLLRTPLPENGTFDVALDPNGGTLRLQGIPPFGDASLYLIHNGAALPVSLVSYLARSDEIALAEEGMYALCSTPTLNDQCVSGVLPRHGALTLTACR